MLVGKNVVFFVFTVTLTILDSSCLGYHLLPHSNTTLLRVARQASCSPPKLRCNNGSCVPFYKICDGTKDCPDGADEYDNCNTNGCNDFAFQCAYSACVDGDSRCNGVEDCRDGSDEVGCNGNTNTINPNTCNPQFTCKSTGDCIPFYKVCDGTKDCPDTSDESYAECKNVPCPDHAFRCSYGACVDGDSRCNGQKECADDSDEDPTICGGGTTPEPVTQTPPLANGFCPEITFTNGKFTVLGVGYTSGPIPNYALVQFSCNNGYGLHPATMLTNCLNGTWNTQLPKCKQTCSGRISTSVDVTCTVGDSPVDCNKPVVEGTIAFSKCKHFYTQSSHEPPVSKCTGGSWDNPLIRCTPECGEVVPDGVVNIVNGTNAKKGEFPWHIGLYRLQNGHYEYQCGGSIITPSIILTAAHCFTNEFGVKFPALEYYIGAGKYYSDYNSEEDKLAQREQVREYHIPVGYRGYETNYASDIAVAIIKKPFQMTNLVQPVCVDWDNGKEREQLKPNNRGSIVGWGYVDPSKHKASEELKQLNAPYIDQGQCLELVPANFRRWITPDKYCAGYTNGSSVCKGDSGGGMVFEWKENNKQKYFIRGLVSVGPVQKGNCDNFQYGVYTQVSFYNTFILRIVGDNQ